MKERERHCLSCRGDQSVWDVRFNLNAYIRITETENWKKCSHLAGNIGLQFGACGCLLQYLSSHRSHLLFRKRLSFFPGVFTQGSHHCYVDTWGSLAQFFL